MKHYCQDIDQVLAQTQSCREGLTSAEAQKRLEANGKNKLAEGKKDDGKPLRAGDIAILSFHDEDGVYADSLALKGKVIIVSVYDTDLNEKEKGKIVAFMKKSEEAGFKTLLLSSTEMDLPHYIADYKTLITLNRSNGGATYINDGFIAGKWAKKSLPTQDELAKISQEDVTESIIGNSRSSLAFQGFLLYVFAVMLLL